MRNAVTRVLAPIVVAGCLGVCGAGCAENNEANITPGTTAPGAPAQKAFGSDEGYRKAAQAGQVGSAAQDAKSYAAAKGKKAAQ
jgi:hypothetical protein